MTTAFATPLDPGTDIEVLYPDAVYDEPDSGPAGRSDDETGAFVCPFCDDAIFERAAGLNIHLGSKHKDHPEAKIPRTGARVPRTPRATPSATKSQQVSRLKKSIQDDLNPWLSLAAVRFGVPQAALQMPVPGTARTVESVIQFDDFESGILARGIVEMQGTNVAESVGRVLGPFIPYAFGLAAIGIAVIHVINMIVLRSTFVRLMEAANGDQQNTPQFV